MKKIAFIISFISIGVFIISCTKYPNIYDAESQKDISLTYYDNAVDFSQYNTYSIVDTVGRVTTNFIGDSLIVVDSPYSTLIRTQMIEQMTQLGYTLVDTASNPDLLLNAHVISLDVEYESYSGGYWDMGYYYGYDPYYYGSTSYWGYGGYSYYYPYSYSYNYTSTYGTVLMEIIDRKNINNNANQFKIVWTGIIAGTTNSESNVIDRITSGIDECFSQSSYLAD